MSDSTEPRKRTSPSADKWINNQYDETIWEAAFREFGESLREYPFDKEVINEKDGWSGDLRDFYDLEEKLYNKNNPSAKRQPLTEEAEREQLWQGVKAFPFFAVLIKEIRETKIMDTIDDGKGNKVLVIVGGDERLVDAKREFLVKQLERARNLSFGDWMKIAQRKVSKGSELEGVVSFLDTIRTKAAIDSVKGGSAANWQRQ